MHWVCYVKEGIHYSEVKVNGPQFTYHAEAHADNMYKTFDMIISKLEKQLGKKKDKFANKIHRRNSHPEIADDPETVWGEYEDEAA